MHENVKTQLKKQHVDISTLWISLICYNPVKLVLVIQQK